MAQAIGRAYVGNQRGRLGREAKKERKVVLPNHLTSALKMEAVYSSKNVGIYLQVHTALQPRRPTSTFSPP
jgi:hypothetical protein